MTTRDLTTRNDQLTRLGASDRLFEVGCALSAWPSGLPNTGAPAKGGSRAGNLLLDLVRTGIENDFEKVVFPQYPELRDIKGALERVGSRYASLSGSGSTLYGERSVSRPRALQRTFHVSQFGKLRKDDFFEVVFNPGTDKVGKQAPGPAPDFCRSTGVM